MATEDNRAVTIDLLLGFLGVSTLVIATPGPDTALTIRNALTGGRRPGIFTALGIATGQATWALFSAAGVAAILTASQPAFTAIRVAGAGYLIWLGLQSLMAAATRSRHHVAEPTGRRAGKRAAFRQGFLSNLANPKMVVFFVSLLPQFTTGRSSFVLMLTLGLLFAAMTLAWLAAYAVAVARAGAFLRRGSLARLIDGLTGVVLVGLGIRLAHD
jgi:RhtB (resistance to homoserine/threonine) family protein